MSVKPAFVLISVLTRTEEILKEQTNNRFVKHILETNRNFQNVRLHTQ